MVKSIAESVKLYFQEYCNHSSVHGIQYLGEKKRTVFERIWWFTVFLIALTACVISIHAVYKKWEGSPVIVNFANKATPIHEIPFPAVTICPEGKFRQSKFNFTQVLQKKEDGDLLTTAEKTFFEYTSRLCYYQEHVKYSTNNTFPDDFYDTIDFLKPSFKKFECSFFNTKEVCIFVPIITDVGICYTFNMLDRSYIYKNTVVHYKNYHKHSMNSSWSFQNGYDKNAGFLAYPMRAFVAGAKNGFIINILTEADELDYSCNNYQSIQGYRILVHSPSTIPRLSQDYFRLPLDQSVVGAIEPTMITTSKRVKTYNPNKRRCYFPQERPLRYFRTYSASNCDLECLTNFTLSMCDCVDFYMPRENGTQMCGNGMVECMKLAADEMQFIVLGVKMKIIKKDEALNLTACNCLPACSALIYDVETSQADWDWKKWVTARRMPINDTSSIHLSSLTLFFKSDDFITTERNEVYGPLDFLANFGGILGLFTGFSVLSLTEILYFLFIRFFCNARLHGQWVVPES